jgi:beta-glucosidase
VYEEDIYVGYRYYDTFNVQVAYEFGYGLSYTSFEYSNMKINTADFRDSVNVSVDIKNTGDTPGREVVQLYCSAPAVKLNKPSKELKAFTKTRLLKPGETETVSFILDARSLASFDTDTSSWVAEAGEYRVQAGASLGDIRLSAVFHVEKEIVVSKVNRALTPSVEISRLKP